MVVDDRMELKDRLVPPAEFSFPFPPYDIQARKLILFISTGLEYHFKPKSILTLNLPKKFSLFQVDFMKALYNTLNKGTYLNQSTLYIPH